MEKKFLRFIASSTTSSCTSVAVCNNSISEAARYDTSFISPAILADRNTNMGRICLPLRLMMNRMIRSNKWLVLFTLSENFFSNNDNSVPITLFTSSMDIHWSYKM